MSFDEKNYIKYKILSDILNYTKSNNSSEDDKTFRENVTNEISNRDSEYTKLLTHFVSITKTRNYLKEFFKWTFYIVIIISILIFMILIYKVSNKFISQGTIEQLIEAIPLFITSIVGLVSVIIAIPIAITKYLFSTKEDENITKIILHTQEHDTTGRQWTLDYNKLADKLNENNIQNNTNKNIS